MDNNNEPGYADFKYTDEEYENFTDQQVAWADKEDKLIVTQATLAEWDKMAARSVH